MPRISIGDCQLYYERQGAGFPVLFVTGLGGNASHWREQAPVFAKSFDTIAFDHRGIGQSDHDKIAYTVDKIAYTVDKIAYTVDKMAADAVALLDALGIDKRACRRPFDRRRHRADPGVRASEAPRQHRHRRELDQGRRLFPPPVRACGKEILPRLGPASYVQATRCSSIQAAISRATTRNCARSRRRRWRPSRRRRSSPSRIDAILAFDRTAELGRIRTPTLVIARPGRPRYPGLFLGGTGPLDPRCGGQVLPAGRPFLQPCPAARVQSGGFAFLNRAHAGGEGRSLKFATSAGRLRVPKVFMGSTG